MTALAIPQAKTRPAARQCTAVRELIEATALHVCTAGDRAALHFYSPAGTTVVRLPLPAFIAACRGERDGNGHPFPAFVPNRREALEKSLAADCAAMPRPDATTDRRRLLGRRLQPEMREKYVAAWLAWRRCEFPSLSAAARHVGLRPNVLCAWCYAHRIELDALPK